MVNLYHGYKNSQKSSHLELNAREENNDENARLMSERHTKEIARLVRVNTARALLSSSHEPQGWHGQAQQKAEGNRRH